MSVRRILSAVFVCLSGSAVAETLQLESLLISDTPAPSPILNAPLAASVFNEPRIDSLGIDSFDELAMRTPSMSLVPGQGGLTIRGIGSPANAYPRSVSVHVDGVYVGDWRFLDAANFFDSERVEILRGPMGARHGRSAMGGVVNLVTAAPSMTWQSEVVARAGNFDYWGLQGLIRGPITDQFAMSIAGSTMRRSAWEQEADSRNDQLSREDDYLRAAFTYHWNNIWYSKLQAFSTETGSGSLDSAYFVNEVAIGDYRIKYVGAWTDSQEISDSDIIAHELQVYSALDIPLNFEVGVEYIEEDVTSASAKSRSTFGSAWSTLQWQLSDKLQAGAGLRFSDDRFRNSEEQSESFWDWHLALDYHFRESHMLYASAATGHGTLAHPMGGEQREQTESLRSVELGYKGRFPAQGLQASAAIFHYSPNEVVEFSDNSLGVEIEATWTPREGLSLGGSFAWADSERPALASKYQVSAYAIASWRWGWARMQASLEYLHRSEFCSAAPNCTAIQPAEDHHQWDLGLSGNYLQWTLKAYVDNVADERSQYPLPTHDTHHSARETLSAPRQYGIELVYQLR